GGAVPPGRGPPSAARSQEAGVEGEDPPAQIAYKDIEEVWAERKSADPHKPGGRSYPIQVVHVGGVLRIPAALDVPSFEVDRFLSSYLPPGGSREVNPLLSDYLRRQQET